MEQALTLFPSLEFVVECDADGSHRPVDILRVKESEVEADLLVGSRYLSESKIQGWPLSRRIFSRLLNFIIPRVLQIDIKDITNGLRRYSIDAVNEITAQPPANKGFIYLSEQALVINDQGLQIEELPIVFIDRTQGVSTVTWREIIASMRGVLGLVALKQKD
jgi:dolichol-phosphate mannosyltransferase